MNSARSADEQRPLLVTGGAGFIGSNFVLSAVAHGHKVVNLDALTYAGNRDNLASLAGNPDHIFVHGSTLDRPLLDRLLAEHCPLAVVHLAAETHVDRSIQDAAPFVATNIDGTFHLLEAVRSYWNSLPSDERAHFRLVHVSTDEVYGSLSASDAPVAEGAPYRPNNPYAATKAAADHLVRAYFHTHGLPVLTTNCSNNYGPFQSPEKLIPLAIHRALQGKTIQVYGDGLQIRDWLHVADHCDALFTVLERGQPGETYHVGGRNHYTNLELLALLTDQLDAMHPQGAPHARLIERIADRPGHDRRYALDATKLERSLGWTPKRTLTQDLHETVQWYLDNRPWLDSMAGR